MAEDVRVPLTRQRRAIAEGMTASAAIPQFALDADVDATGLIEFRARGSVAFSFSDAVTGAVAAALRLHPSANASFDGDAIIQHGNVNIGLALAGPEGLIVVVINRADTLDLAALQRERLRLTDALAHGSLRGEELFGATSVVSNLGPVGISRFHALLVPSVATILAVGRIEERPAVRQGKIEATATMSLSLTCDHRVLDGIAGAAVLKEIVRHLENPEYLMNK